MPTALALIAGAHVVPVKFKTSNQLPSVNVGTAAPLVIDKLGAVVVEPPVVPNVYVLVTLASATKPPVPVQVRLVAVPMANTVVAAVVCANTILPEPNAIERTLLLEEENIPVVKLYPFRFNVPVVRVYVLVAGNVRFAPNVTLPVVCVNVGGPSVPPL